MDYGSLIREAWTLTWRYRFLWVLGLFVGGGVGSFPGGSNFQSSNSRDFQEIAPPDVVRAMEDMTAWVADHLALIVAAVGLLVLLVLVLLVVSLIAQGGMAAATADLARGRPTSAGQAWRAGLRFFWRYLGLQLLLIAAVLVVAVVVGGVVALAIGVGVLAGGAARALLIVLGVLAAIAAVLVAIPIGIGVSVVVTYAQRAIAVDDVGPIAALRRGYRLLRAHLGASLVVWLVNLGLGIGAGIAVLVLAIAAFAVLAVAGVAVYALAGFTTATYVYIALAVFVLILALWGVGAVVNTFFWSYWTIAYLRLAGRPTSSA